MVFDKATGVYTLLESDLRSILTYIEAVEVRAEGEKSATAEVARNVTARGKTKGPRSGLIYIRIEY